ncbi:hypothetical protein MTHERMMSTA1_14890 [Methanosarcina thermophila MST-A1]|jgi:hypothetical protein|uniref:Uncharacterized protein n=1 Tax=Methanosarcina thermophila CHTI-55 TaxID=1434121 RepID=A0A0E3KRV4_METTE|nr:hypothetical protein [Methanosarcina thermophila]AKB16293.1 hypothetical protein MSTHC_1975 [Methanosarcina thermophila CHTI-55]GLI14363.1 hypothetical protein MTHERMMSTA1_14890 [Methanosarcina thermophila MST-A1]
MEKPKLSDNAKGKVPQFVKLVKEELQKKNINVSEKDLESSLLEAQERLGCEQCANGARW